MLITWQFEMRKVATGNESIKQSIQFKAATIREAKEKADDIITQNTSPLSGEAADFEWLLDEQKKTYYKSVLPTKNTARQRRHRGSTLTSILCNNRTTWYLIIRN